MFSLFCGFPAPNLQKCDHATWRNHRKQEHKEGLQQWGKEQEREQQDTGDMDNWENTAGWFQLGRGGGINTDGVVIRKDKEH